MSKSPITCHILDASLGKPASGVAVSLHRLEGGSGQSPQCGSDATNSDGRCLNLLPHKGSEAEAEARSALQPGQDYKIVFETKEYFARTGRESFYPRVEILFTIQNPEEHYHVPLLISPFSYTTYRGS